MAEIKAVKAVWGNPEELKKIRGVSPIAGKITLQFSNTDVASVRINKGPKLWLEDKGDHWLVGGEIGKPNKLSGHKITRQNHVSED